MKAVKTIAALIFLTALGIVLVQPVLGAGDGEVKPRAGTSASGETDGPDTDAGNDGDDESSADHLELTARYPKRCMRPAGDEATGLVAARRGSSVTIGPPEREVFLARYGVTGDVAWSPSGRYLAERGGELYDTLGTPLGSLFFEAAQWAWSPVADCVFSLTDNGALTFGIPETKVRGRRLLDVPVTEFALSPDGERLAVVTDSGLWTVRLRSGKALQVTSGRAALSGWYSNRSVLFSKSAGSGKLRYGKGAEARVLKGAFASASLVTCDGRRLLTAQATEGDAPLAEIVARNGRLTRKVLPGTPAEYAGFSGAACSPDGGFIAASALTADGDKGPLVLLQADGTLVREIMPGRTANPTWTSQGLLFVRFGAQRGRLWFIPPNSAPVETTFTVGAPAQYDWHAR